MENVKLDAQLERAFGNKHKREADGSLDRAPGAVENPQKLPPKPKLGKKSGSKPKSKPEDKSQRKIDDFFKRG